MGQPPPTLATMLADEMKVRGHTQQDAATVMRVTQPRLSRWLAGHPPGDDKIPQLARYLAIPEAEVAVLVYETRRAPRPESTADRVHALEQRVTAIAGDLVEIRRLLEAADRTPRKQPASTKRPARRSSGAR